MSKVPSERPGMTLGLDAGRSSRPDSSRPGAPPTGALGPRDRCCSHPLKGPRNPYFMALGTQIPRIKRTLNDRDLGVGCAGQGSRAFGVDAVRSGEEGGGEEGSPRFLAFGAWFR